MNLPILQHQNSQSSVASMNSLQIAELVEARHDNVKRTIEALAAPNERRPAVIACPQIEVMPNMVNNRVYNTEVFVFRGEQGRLDSITVVAQLCPQFTAALVRRWDELERQAQQPKELSRMEILQLAMQAEQENIALRGQLAIAQPKADALDVISVASNSLNIHETAKTLGVQEKKFIAWAIKHDWLYRDAKSKLCPIAHRIQNGFLEQRAVPYNKPNGEVGVSTQAMFTAKALTHLAKLFAIVKEVA